MNSCFKNNRSTELLKAWEAGLKENSSNPLVRKKLEKSGFPLQDCGNDNTISSPLRGEDKDGVKAFSPHSPNSMKILHPFQEE